MCVSSGSRHPPGQGGVDSRPAASMRETDRNQVGTEQNEFLETPTGFDGRGHLQDSDGPKTLDTIFCGFGDP